MVTLLLLFWGILVFLFGIWLRDTVFVVKIHKFLKSIFNNAEEEKARKRIERETYQQAISGRLITKKVHEEKQAEIIAKF